MLAAALAVALPGSLATNESFRPIEQRLRLQGSMADWRFDLAGPEPLFLDYGFTVRPGRVDRRAEHTAAPAAPSDTHWNIAGNRLAASEIARYLTEGVLEGRTGTRDLASPLPR